MPAVERLAGRGQDRPRQALVRPQSIRELHAIHPPRARLVERQHRGRGRAGEIAAHHHLHRQDVEAARDDHVRVGIVEHVVRADIARRLEPEARALGQHLALERHRAEDAIEGAQPIAGDDDAPPVRQVVIVADLAAIVVWQLGDESVAENLVRVGAKGGRIHTLTPWRRQRGDDRQGRARRGAGELGAADPARLGDVAAPGQVDIGLDDIGRPHACRRQDRQQIVPGPLGLGGEALLQGAVRPDADLARHVEPTRAGRHLDRLAVAAEGRRDGRRVDRLQHGSLLCRAAPVAARLGGRYLFVR